MQVQGLRVGWVEPTGRGGAGQGNKQVSALRHGRHGGGSGRGGRGGGQGGEAGGEAGREAGGGQGGLAVCKGLFEAKNSSPSGSIRLGGVSH